MPRRPRFAGAAAVLFVAAPFAGTVPFCRAQRALAAAAILALAAADMRRRRG
jgi:hypothetical protein